MCSSLAQMVNLTKFGSRRRLHRHQSQCRVGRIVLLNAALRSRLPLLPDGRDQSPVQSTAAPTEHEAQTCMYARSTPMMSSLNDHKHHPFFSLLRDTNAGQLTGEVGAKELLGIIRCIAQIPNLRFRCRSAWSRAMNAPKRRLCPNGRP